VTVARENSNAPSIAVVIPTKDRPSRLARALTSVFRQTVPPAEIIVVDDGSTPPVSNAIFDGVPRGVVTKLLRHDVPKGASASRNLGISAASSEFISFLDDDDEFLPNKIEFLSKKIAELDCDIIHHSATIAYDIEGVQYNTSINTGFNFEELLTENLVGGTPVSCVKRHLLLEIGSFDSELPALQDWDLWLRAAQRGARFCSVPSVLVICHNETGLPSITKSSHNLTSAVSLIDRKFAKELSLLTPAQKRRRKKTDYQRLAYRFAMAGDHIAAARTYFDGAVITMSPKLLIAASVSLLGSKYLYRLRALMTR
jgi:glycosyltransferase involved in cell wall biosynthesis